MRFHAIVLALALGTAACAARAPYRTNSSANRLTSATVTFTSLDDGKDADSALTVQLLRRGNELAAEAQTMGTKFDDHATAAPVLLNVEGPLTEADADDALMRLRLVPDGRDTWTFNVRMTLTFANNEQRTFGWRDVRLDERSPERTLTLAGARTS